MSGCLPTACWRKAAGAEGFPKHKGVRFAGTMQVTDADLRPLRPPADTGSLGALPLKLALRVAVTGGTATFDNIDAKIGGTAIRGHLAADNGSPRRIDGALEADS